MDEMNSQQIRKTIYQANKILGKVESTISIILLWALIVVCMNFYFLSLYFPLFHTLG